MHHTCKSQQEKQGRGEKSARIQARVNEGIRVWLWQGLAALVLVCILLCLVQQNAQRGRAAALHTHLQHTTQPANHHTTACATTGRTTPAARPAPTGLQATSVPLWLAGAIGLSGMLAGGMVAYLMLPPRVENFIYASDMSEDGEELA